MFRSFKNKSEKSGERFDFKFSNLQALQVPKGWDKLLVSIISMDSGKTISKSSKVLVRNGNCRWVDTFSESVWIPKGEASTESQECLFKFVVSMGSSRSSILGEATVNLVSYINTKGAAPLSLPLKKCTHGTVLQVKIQCLTPKTKLRDEQWKETDTDLVDGNTDFDELENKSDTSDVSFTKSVGSSSSNHLEAEIQPGELISRDTSFSASGSRNSFESLDGSFGRESYSPRSGNTIGRQDSGGSPHGPYSYNEFSRSNNSLLNSKLSSSGSYLQNQREDVNRIPRAVPSSPLRNAGSSKDLLEVAEIKIEELRAEARMWEQNARKLMSDVENLQKESLDQSSLEKELSISRAECDDLKQEVEQLKILSKSSMKQAAANGAQKELENEVKFQREENANLVGQLKKTQESNIELVSILQELEETIEKQKNEIDSLSKVNMESKDSGMDGHGCEDHSNDTLELQLLQLHESHKKLESTIQSLEESLEDKNSELETEKHLKSQSLTESGEEWKRRLGEKEKKIVDLETKLSKALDAQESKELAVESEGDLVTEVEVLRVKVQELERDCNELTAENLDLLFQLKESKKELPSCIPSSDSSLHQSPADHLHTQSVDLENKCAELEQQLKSFEERASYLEGELADCRARVEEQESEIAKLRQQLDYYGEMETESKETENSESLAAMELSKLLTELDDQIQLSSAKLKKSCTHYQLSHAQSAQGSGNVEIQEGIDVISQKMQAEVILNSFIQLKQLFEAMGTFYDNELQNSKEALSQRDSSDAEKELSARVSEMDKLKADDLVKEEELEALRLCKEQLESQVSSLKEEKSQMEEKVEITLRENSCTTKCLEDLRNQISVINGNMDFQVAANKVLDEKSLELESSRHELEVHLSELEDENVQLSERLSGMEAQLRYLTDEKESSRLELQNSEAKAMSLKDEIRRLETEMEAQKVDMRQKLEEMQKRWLEAQEECEYLKVANPKLQATAENLIEECGLLQNANAELRKQKTQLHDQCAVLEAELKESEKVFSQMLSRVEDLEEKYSTVVEEIASKERALNFEIDALVQENSKEKDKLVTESSLLNQMYVEKTVEVDNLQRELAHLTEQISATQDEKEKTGSEAVLEVSHLRADKAMLSGALQEVQQKLQLSERNLKALRLEFETEVQGLKEEVAVARQKEEVLMADNEKLLALLEGVKSSGEKQKTTVRNLEMKLKTSEYESLQLAEEISNLLAHLQKTALLQDEILALKKTVSETKFEKERLEASLQMLSSDYEELQAERTSFLEKLSSSQEAISELDESRRKRVALEEKVLRLQGDLTAREAMGAQEAAVKNELAQIRRENSQLQRKIKGLEKEKEEHMKRTQVLEEELKQIKEMKETVTPEEPISNTRSISINGDSNVSPVVDDKQNCNGNGSHALEFDPISKIQSLENELAEALEANDMYKSQLRSLLSEQVNGHPEKLTGEQPAVRSRGSLEAELKDLREKYFHMSLKYAEVEAQREQLVMKLKATNGRRSWFK